MNTSEKYLKEEVMLENFDKDDRSKSLRAASACARYKPRLGAECNLEKNQPEKIMKKGKDESVNQRSCSILRNHSGEKIRRGSKCKALSY